MLRKLLLPIILTGIGLFVFSVLLSAEIATAAAPSATFTVTSTFDSPDLSPGDGTCGAFVPPDFLECTLRAAVMEANALTGTDTIELLAGIYTLDIVGSAEDASATGDLDILSEITIIGSDPYSTVISAAPGFGDRIIHLPPESVGPLRATTALTLTDVTITGGRLPAAGFCGPGSPGGGGISNEGNTLALGNVHVLENMAHCGGGLFDDGTTAIANSFFFSNTATTDNGGAILQGGGSMVIANTLIRDNFAIAGMGARGPIGPPVGMGGGIFNVNALLTISYSAIEWNFAERGAGISNIGTLFMTDSAFIENMAGTEGGGLHNMAAADLSNVTFSKNSATGNAAAILTTSPGSITPPVRGLPEVETKLAFSTVASNTIVVSTTTVAAGVWSEPGTTTEFTASILDSNTMGPSGVSANCTASALPISGNYNLDSDSSCLFAGADDISGVPALLAPLANNGAELLDASFFPPPAVEDGPYGSRTHALLEGSPAIDGIAEEVRRGFFICPPPATDQRRAPRAFDGDGDFIDECDIGAYEFGAMPDVPTAVTLKENGAITSLSITLIFCFALTLGLLTLRQGRKTTLD